MIIERHNQEATPSVYFNFDNSNQKTSQLGLDQSAVLFQYSMTKSKNQCTSNKNINIGYDKFQCQFVTPPSYLRSNICKNLLDTSNIHGEEVTRNQTRLNKVNDQPINVKLDTEEFFQQFQNNFVINFDDSPGKIQPVAVQFKKTFQSCPGAMDVKDSMNSKVDSFISEPFVRRLSIQPVENENEQDIITIKIEPKVNLDIKNDDISLSEVQKQNKPPQSLSNLTKKQSKINCEIRKRILHKNSDRIFDKMIKNGKNKKQIIKPENLLIISSSNWERWTDAPKNKKFGPAMNSQPIKSIQKQIKRAEVNIFSSRQMFKETLRSTTLDNWKKKFSIHKNEQKSKGTSIFQKPFNLLR